MQFDISKIDFDALREQKNTLLSVIEFSKELPQKEKDNLDGLVHMIDDIQDKAAETLGEEAVFGEQIEE